VERRLTHRRGFTAEPTARARHRQLLRHRAILARLELRLRRRRPALVRRVEDSRTRVLPLPERLPAELVCLVDLGSGPTALGILWADAQGFRLAPIGIGALLRRVLLTAATLAKPGLVHFGRLDRLRVLLARDVATD